MRKFKTESQKLLDLMINSIYTNQEIFLRELISNASDAVDKLHFISLTDKNLDFSKESFEIFVSFDKKERTITVTDNGIGMTKDELDKNLGTIAHSDSMLFKDDNSDKQGDDVDIIGQFGVGFYSVFMVAKNVDVISKSYKEGSDSYIWKSDGIKGYDIEPGNRKNRGTEVILHLKDDTKDCNYSKFLDENELTELIKRFSNYVRYPIKMETTQRREKPKPKDAGDDYTPEFEDYKEIQTINSMVPIWKQKKSQVKKEDYNEFYKNNFHDYTDPQLYFDIHAEGTLNYDALIYIPSMAPMDLYTKDYKKGLQLYTSNVMIMEKCEELVPDYYNFVKGVVDSPDLTLNISRETLQHNSQLQAIARRIEKRIKKELKKMLDKNREGYEKFYNNFGRVLKFGIYSSYGNKKDELADLLLFHSAKLKKMVTFSEYIKETDEKPQYIYYAAGKDKDQISKLPAVTTLLKKDYDVLLLNDDIDEFCISAMFSFEDVQFKNVSSGDLGIDTDKEKKETEKLADTNKKLLETMKKALPDDVSRVTISNRATDAPACISAEGPTSFEMERVMSGMSSGGSDSSFGGLQATRVLELNPKHKVFSVLKKAQKDKDTKKINQYAKILYDQALLMEGLPIKDPIEYGKNVAKLMI